MDYNYNPREQANEITKGESILDDYSNQDQDTPQEISSTLVEDANPYTVTEALETLIPGISY